MAKDKMELDALTAMGFSVGCQVVALKGAITSQLRLSPEQLAAFNAEYDKTYRSQMEDLIEGLEEEENPAAELLRELVSEPEGEPEEPTTEADNSLLKKIKAACASVVGEKPCLLSRDLHERTITGRVAYYLQPLITDSFVDCEYNKMADGLKGDVLKRLAEYDKDFVVPDIIIHDRKRGTAGNLSVIEAKWSDDKTGIEREKRKLALYLTEPKLAYKSAFLILLGKDSIDVESIG